MDLHEGRSGDSVVGIALAGDGSAGNSDLLSARNGRSSSISAAEVVHGHGVGPVGLDSSVVVVHALVASNRTVDANVHGRNLVISEPALSDVITVQMSGTEVDVSAASGGSATNNGVNGDRTALVQRSQVVEVVDVREHLRANQEMNV